MIPDPRGVARSEDKGIHIVHPRDVLHATIDFLGTRVESKHIQRVIMSWIQGKGLAEDVESFEEGLRLYREQAMLKVLLQRDTMVENYYAKK